MGMSSQFPTKTTRKKMAHVMVANSMRPEISLGNGTSDRQPGFAGRPIGRPALLQRTAA